jgi:hypothetical protein
MLEAAAGKAELIVQIRSFVAWAGPARKLTATGRIGLADARRLVDLLGTGDTIDPDIGGRASRRGPARNSLISTGSWSGRRPRAWSGSAATGW